MRTVCPHTVTSRKYLRKMRSRVRGESVTKRSMRGFNREALTAAREAKQWSLARLAREAEIGLSTIRSWETGARAPEPDNLAKAAAALGVSMNALISPRPGGPTLADLRILVGLTQPQLGLRTGLSTTSIGALERAEIRLTDERARRIAEALQLTVAQVNDAYRAARERADDVP